MRRTSLPILTLAVAALAGCRLLGSDAPRSDNAFILPPQTRDALDDVRESRDLNEACAAAGGLVLTQHSGISPEAVALAAIDFTNPHRPRLGHVHGYEGREASELAAMVLTDAGTRLIPGVLGNEASAATESFNEPILEHPQYTRPRDFRRQGVPEILLSGNHEAIESWRRGQSLYRTRQRRPDLFAKLILSRWDEELLRRAEQENEIHSRKSVPTDVQENGFAICRSGALSSSESQR